MNYLKSFFHVFLTVFFTNQFLPGIEVVNHTKLPHIGSDVLFAGIVGLVLSLVFPVMKLIDHQMRLGRIAIACGSISLVSYILAKFVPFIAINIDSLEAFLLAVIVVFAGSFAINYLEFKRNSSVPRPPEMPKF